MWGFFPPLHYLEALGQSDSTETGCLSKNWGQNICLIAGLFQDTGELFCGGHVFKMHSCDRDFKLSI